jgi:hypothetical protein
LKRENKLKRGKPQEWPDNELKELATKVKYKLNGKRLSPSLLQRETGVGRNTWSRRMSDFIEELNNPVVRSIHLEGNNDIHLPNIDQIFERHGNNNQALKNDLLQLELIIFDLYDELKKYKSKFEESAKTQKEINEIKDELSKQKQRAVHYEQLYNSIMVSSAFPHLYNEKRSKINEAGIKDNLINFNRNQKENLDLSNLQSHFPNINEKKLSDGENQVLESKRNSTLKKLMEEFDLPD